jgi:hypothetical protein
MQRIDSDSDTNSSINNVDDIYNEIMYHVLGQFLVTKDNKNIATVLEDLTNELKNIRIILNDFQSSSTLSSGDADLLKKNVQQAVPSTTSVLTQEVINQEHIE